MTARTGQTRGTTAVLLVLTLAFGIASRRVHLGVSLWDKSLGDALYAVAVYLGLALLASFAPPLPPRVDRIFRSRWTLALTAFAVCFAIELFQLTGIPLELARTRPWVRWILGGGFEWHDVACYAVGVLAIMLARK